MDVSCYCRLSSLKPLDSSSWEMSSYDRSYRLGSCTSRDGNERFTSSTNTHACKSFPSCACKGKQGTWSQKLSAVYFRREWIYSWSVPMSQQTSQGLTSASGLVTIRVDLRILHTKRDGSTVCKVGRHLGCGPHRWPHDTPSADRRPKSNYPRLTAEELLQEPKCNFVSHLIIWYRR